MGSEFPAALQRPQPAQPRRQQGPRQAGELKQARELTRPGLHRRHNRQWEPLLHPRRVPTPQQIEEHTRVRRPRPGPQRSGRVKHLPQALTDEAVLHRQKNDRLVRKKSRSSQRQVIAAKLKRNLKLSELHRKERPQARKQRNQRGSGHEVAKPQLHRNDNKKNQFGLTVSVNTTANQPGI